jgi:hypothetical protein
MELTSILTLLESFFVGLLVLRATGNIALHGRKDLG